MNTNTLLLALLLLRSLISVALGVIRLGNTSESQLGGQSLKDFRVGPPQRPMGNGRPASRIRAYLRTPNLSQLNVA